MLLLKTDTASGNGEKPMKLIQNETHDEERAFYDSHDIHLQNCVFEGPADGESALKESSNVLTEDCFYRLRYPFWHDTTLKIVRCELTPACRAAIWYSQDVEIVDSRLHGIKAMRECHDVTLRGCDVISPEFGWSVSGMRMEDCTAESEYFMMRSDHLRLQNVRFKGKYSFQYVKDVVVENCELDTKDAFWHAENVTVRNSVVKGEYLAWYSDGLTLDHCKIIGTQPLCYCKNLTLIDCEMVDTDLAFEKSDVEASLTAPIVSIKNPRSGHITVPAVGEIIRDDAASHGEIIVTG